MAASLHLHYPPTNSAVFTLLYHSAVLLPLLHSFYSCALFCIAPGILSCIPFLSRALPFPVALLLIFEMFRISCTLLSIRIHFIFLPKLSFSIHTNRANEFFIKILLSKKKNYGVLAYTKYCVEGQCEWTMNPFEFTCEKKPVKSTVRHKIQVVHFQSEL